MTAPILWENRRGQTRWQPALRDGRRLTSKGWQRPNDKPIFTNGNPILYRSRKRAARIGRDGDASIQHYYETTFHEADLDH